MTPLIANKLYQSVSIPKFTYGVEAMDIGSEVINMQEWEALHCYTAELIQGLPWQVASPGGLVS